MSQTMRALTQQDSLGNSQQLRAERVTSLPENLEVSVVADGTECELLNLSESGLAFRVREFRHERGARFPLEIRLETKAVFYRGEANAVWVSREKDGIRVGASFASHLLPQDFPKALQALAQIKQKAMSDLSQVEGLPDEFKGFLLEFKTYLHTLKTMLDDLERRLMPMSLDVKESHRKAVEAWLGPKVVKRVHEFNVSLGVLIPKFESPSQRKAAAALFKTELNPYLIVSPFTERAFTKPRGYAGDYEMMNQIYRNEYEGPSLYAQIIHKYATNEASSQSVRYRKDYLHRKFQEMIAEKSGEITIASLACGPAREVAEFLQSASAETIKRCSFVLFDQDVEALLDAKKSIQKVTLERGVQVRLSFIPLSVRDILEVGSEVQAVRNLNIDFLYSAGLYDYLSQPLARALTAELCSLVRPGGQVTIGNFHPDNPTKAISEFSADWRLIHRTETQMLDLVPKKFSEKAAVFMDDQGIELFLTIKVE